MRTVLVVMILLLVVPATAQYQFSGSKAAHDSLAAKLDSLSTANPDLYKWLMVAFTIGGDNIAKYTDSQIRVRAVELPKYAPRGFAAKMNTRVDSLVMYFHKLKC